MTTDNNLVKTGDARNSPGDAISDIDLDYENFTERTPLLSILCITYNHEKYIGGKKISEQFHDDGPCGFGRGALMVPVAGL